MFPIDEAEPASASDHFVRIQKPVVMHQINNACPRISCSIEELLDTTVFVYRSQLSSFRCPGEPSLPGRIATFESKTTLHRQMVVYGSQHSDHVVVVQQSLESMTGHIDEIESQGQTQALSVRLDPCDSLGSRARSRDVQHAFGRVSRSNA